MSFVNVSIGRMLAPSYASVGAALADAIPNMLATRRPWRKAAHAAARRKVWAAPPAAVGPVTVAAPPDSPPVAVGSSAPPLVAPAPEPEPTPPVAVAPIADADEQLRRALADTPRWVAGPGKRHKYTPAQVAKAVSRDTGKGAMAQRMQQAAHAQGLVSDGKFAVTATPEQVAPHYPKPEGETGKCMWEWVKDIYRDCEKGAAYGDIVAHDPWRNWLLLRNTKGETTIVSGKYLDYIVAFIRKGDRPAIKFKGSESPVCVSGMGIGCSLIMPISRGDDKDIVIRSPHKPSPLDEFFSPLAAVDCGPVEKTRVSKAGGKQSYRMYTQLCQLDIRETGDGWTVAPTAYRAKPYGTLATRDEAEHLAALILEHAHGNMYGQPEFYYSGMAPAAPSVAAVESIPEPPAERKEVFTTGDVAKICQVAPRTVSKWFDSGKLGGYRIPGSNDRRIPRDRLLAFLVDNGISPAVEF